ncbi:dUTP diphosphatase [Cyanobacterium sp. uoEpiScrs1]|uniref:dUTP diphosphatase n=1 Tax=Cyanobacterium sp. uoEpiScrs1 TaxID=2976343 RepID=UPI0022699B68|nr:dUTP diphosphatase [Cyanobacterium sp. uoEpiScrs1]
MKLKIIKLREQAVIPKYEHDNDSGLDLISIENVKIESGDSQLVKIGISIELPPNTEAQIRPRSGLALRHKVTILNAPGTIDEGYRGEIGVILINHGQTSFQVIQGMRIAQMVIVPVIRVKIEEVDSLSNTIRGSRGFGSTGF